MMRPLFLKIFVLCLSLVVLLASSVLLVSFRLIRSNTVDLLSGDLERQARAFEGVLVAALQSGDEARLSGLVGDMADSLEVRVTVIDTDGRVLADSNEDAASMENHRFRPEVQEALEGRPGRSERTSRTLQADMLYVGRPLNAGGKTIAVVRLSSFVRDIEAMLSGLRSGLWRLTAVVTLLAAAAAFVVSRTLTRPVRRMIDVSRRVSAGDFQAKVYHPGRDELGELGRSLNAMTAQLGILVESLRLQREELNGVLESMREGLVLIDGDDRIRLCNRSFKNIAGWDEPRGARYWEVVRSAAFSDLVGHVREGSACLSRRIELGERLYLVSASRLTSPERTLAVFHDETEAAGLEKMKRELVVNMSHELRTPLTSVKGTLELLEDDVAPNGRSRLEVARRNTDRLIKIVDDLLALSALEGREPVVQAESVDLKSLAADSLSLFEPAARAKGIGLRLDAGGPSLSVRGDPFRLEQMFVNLLDNAVKYSDAGEVTLSLGSEGKNAVISFRDTGVGIAPEHLPRLFERFYVVDPSRSRALGGTGLGLAIVKHIVLLHGGEISVSSSPGRGSCFTVKLPLQPE
jgi:two-component system phosphate regulon sensor histidine kinase PhoR